MSNDQQMSAPARLVLTRMRRPATALAVSVTLLAPRPPFDKAPFGPMISTLSGAIKRGHYIFSLRDREPCGFSCWALADEDTARRWAAERLLPTDVLGEDGDVVVMFHVVGDARDAVTLGFRHIASRYPGRHWVMHRFGRRRGATWGRFADPARSAPEVRLV